MERITQTLEALRHGDASGLNIHVLTSAVVGMVATLPHPRLTFPVLLPRKATFVTKVAYNERAAGGFKPKAFDTVSADVLAADRQRMYEDIMSNGTRPFEETFGFGLYE